MAKLVRKRCRVALAAILLAAEGMPKGLSFVGSGSLFLSATMYVVLRIFAILLGRSPWITLVKKAKMLGLTKVFCHTFWRVCVMRPI